MTAKTSEKKQDRELSGKVAIVTGSTSGIGLGIAEAFAGAGMNVVLNGFGPSEEIERTRSGLEERSGVKVGLLAGRHVEARGHPRHGRDGR